MRRWNSSGRWVTTWLTSAGWDGQVSLWKAHSLARLGDFWAKVFEGSLCISLVFGFPGILPEPVSLKPLSITVNHHGALSHAMAQMEKKINLFAGEKFYIIKMAIITKAFYRFRTIPIEIQMIYFPELEQIFQKLIWNHEKRPWTVTAILRKNKVEEITLSDIKLYYKVIVIKTAQYWHKNRYIGQ